MRDVREDGRTRAANTRESFPLLHMVAFHTSRARCLNCPLLNFLFSSLPLTKNAIFRLPAQHATSPLSETPLRGLPRLPPAPRAASPLAEGDPLSTVKCKSSGGISTRCRYLRSRGFAKPSLSSWGRQLGEAAAVGPETSPEAARASGSCRALNQDIKQPHVSER